MVSKIGKKDLTVPLAKDILPKLATKATSSALEKIYKKNKWSRSCKSWKKIRFIPFK